MKLTIYMGSPKANGNTAALLAPFLRVLEEEKVVYQVIHLYEKDIRPCYGCKICQDVMDDFGCISDDDVQQMYRAFLDSDAVVFATPIYAWYCTAPMKALMDRLIYAGCKYYGAVRGGSTLNGKTVATLVTCGYPPEKGADVWESGLKRWCKHCAADYAGMFCHRDTGRADEFMNERAEQGVQQFARDLISRLK